MKFSDIKSKVVAGLVSGDYAHEGRGDIDDKNLLQAGKVSPKEVARLLGRCRSQDLTTSAHHQDETVEVYIAKIESWYIKFYFDPDTLFISVHK